MKATLQTRFSERPRDDECNDVCELCRFVEEPNGLTRVFPKGWIPDNNPLRDSRTRSKFHKKVLLKYFKMFRVDVDTGSPLWRQKLEKCAVACRRLQKMGRIAVGRGNQLIEKVQAIRGDSS